MDVLACVCELLCYIFKGILRIHTQSVVTLFIISNYSEIHKQIREAKYDVSDKLEITVGARYYDIEVDFEGSANSSFFNLGQTADAQAFGTNISAQFAPDNTVGAPDIVC